MKGLAALVLAAAAPLLAAASPIVRQPSPEPKLIPNQYIVFFKDHVSAEHAAAHHGWVQGLHVQSQGGSTSDHLELRKRSGLDSLFEGLKHTYALPGLFGYSGHFDDTVVEQIRKHPDVEHVEQDSEVHTLSETETAAPWGLARISHRDALTFSTYDKYLYSQTAGAGVDVYVIDTGTYTAHTDFEGRASWGATIPEGDQDVDGNGHGTHCSGTIAGAKYGVAKKAHVYAVKVLRSNGTGTMSDVIKGVEWAATQHVKKAADASKGKVKGFKGSVANMSLGGGKSPGLDRMVNAAVEAGMHFAVAAGNDNADSCNSSPASAQKAVTVGASTLTDERAYFSNFGTCNDIFAPGLNILSTWIGGPVATNVISGTSMASPHIAGLLAYLLSLQPDSDSAFATDTLTPAKLKKSIISIGTTGVLTDVPDDTANVLAWNGGGSSNWTQIVSNGAAAASKKPAAAKPSKLELLEELIDEEFDELKADFKEMIRETM